MELYQNEHFQMGNDNENLQIVICYIDTRNHELTHSGQNKVKDMIQLTNQIKFKSNQISLLPCQYTIWWEAYINSYTAMGDIEASAYWSPVLIKVLLKLTMAMFYIITT